jgi:hypothetical protein
MAAKIAGKEINAWQPVRGRNALRSIGTYGGD